MATAEPPTLSIGYQTETEIVAELEKNESRQYTEAAHAEMMRRQILSYEKAGRKMFWLTVVIGVVAFLNLIFGILNFFRK